MAEILNLILDSDVYLGVCERPIHGLFTEWARLAPGATAVRAPEGEITYGELDARSDALAACLRGFGVGPETLVALSAERSIEMVVALLAILKAGGAYVPVDPSYPAERQALLLEDSGAPVLLTQERLAGSLPAGRARVILLDRPTEGAGEAGSFEPAETGGDHLAYVIYTSGSTGRPKGVAVPHRGVLRLVLGTDYAQISPVDRVAQVANASFDAATFEIWGALLNGGTLVILPLEVALSPAALASEIRRQGIDAMFLTTSLFNQVAREVPGAFAPLTHLLVGGEAADPASMRAVLREGPPRRLLNAYGPTENTTFSTCHEVREVPPEALTVPIGKPIANSSALVLDRGLRPVPAGVQGSLYVGGAGLARGYFDRPDLTAERFVPDPFAGEAGDQPGGRLYATGDLARWRPDGGLEFLGRMDHQVKIRGFRVELGEIEATLADHPAVRGAAVLAREAAGGSRLVAYVAADGAPDLEAVREHLAVRLPDYMVPSAFVRLETLPLTPNGKVDRRALERIGGIAEPSEAYVAPRTPVERVLADLWAEVLERERVGVRDDFLRLGGHSLLAAQVLSRVRRRFGVEIGIQALFESPTAEGFGRTVERALEGASRPAAAWLPELSREGWLPLSSAQARLWFLDRLRPGSSLYNIALAVRLRGRLERTALAGALGEIVRRHEALRTRFEETADGPAQVIEPAGLFILPEVDLRALPEPERHREAERLGREESLRPFDLARGPLLRALLARTGGEEWELALTVHHIVADGLSMRVLLRELEALYRASPLSEPPLQYADYAAWQREALRGEALAAELAWWREHLAGAPTVLELPADRSHPPEQSFRGGVVERRLGTELRAALRELGRREGATLFMTALAACELLLHRLTGQSDLLLGMPVSGRGRLELEGLIGLFVNTLALRARLDGDPTARELLGRARAETLAVQAHQELPFEKLVEEIAPERSLSRSPLLQAVFSLRDSGWMGLDLPGIAAESRLLDVRGAKFDLGLVLVDHGGFLTAAVEYGADLFDPATAARMLGHFERLLEGMAAGPERRISELEMLSQAERHQLAAEWNDSAADEVVGNVPEWFSEQARARPEALALEAILKAGAERLSYGELEARSNRLANRLRSLGLGRDLLVGICLERSAELVVAILGALKAGGAYLPLDPAHPRERLAYVLEDSGAAVVISRRGLIADLPVADRGLLLLDEADLAGESAEVPEVEVRPGDLAYVIYTSGSTGRPKGVRVEHGNLSNLLLAGRQAFGFDETDVMPALAPFSFDIFLFELLNPLVAGGTSILVSLEGGPDLGLLTSLLERVTRLHAVPALMQQIVERVRSEGAAAGRYRGLRTLFTGGDAVPAGLLAELRETFPGTEVRVLYGPTEATIIASSDMVPAAGPVRSRLGRPLPNMALRLFDAAGRPAPVGVPGEIWIGGRGVARGYLNRPELTAERYPEIVGERWYRTGDLARRLPDGALEFLGRADDQVKIRGFRIELGEVESALLGLPGVREAAVLAEGEGNGRRLVAWLSPEPGAELEVAALREGLRSVLPDYMIPAAFALLESLPLTANGKVDRRALARAAVTSLETGSAWVAPRNPIESELAGIWAELLGVERVGVTDDFFALGGHSLLAVQALSRVRRAFGAEVALRGLFESPTVESLALAVERELGTAGEDPIARAPRDRELPASFSQESLWLLARLQGDSSVYNVPAAWRLTGNLQPPVLAAALREAARRHEPLRTRFAEGADGGPVQVIDPPAPQEMTALPWIDLSGLDARARRREESRLLSEESRWPFDLARGPLLRTLLLQMAPEEWTLSLVVHHIVSDGWSIGVLARELEALYASALADRPSPLPEPVLQFADFAVWQRERLRGEALESRLAWWREHLAGAPTVLELPSDRPRRAEPSFRGGAVSFRLSPERAAALRDLGRRRGTTLFMTLLAGFELLLHRYSGQDDLLVGMPVAGREREELEGLIGYFVNTLVARARLEGDPAVGGLLDRAREETLAVTARPDLPFEKLVEELAPARSPGLSPLIQTLFTLRGAGWEGLDLPGLTSRPLPVSLDGAKLDLGLSVVERGEGLEGILDYSADLFDSATAARMLGHFERLLEGIAAGPERRISELEMLSEAERHQLAAEWNDSAVEGLAGNVPEWFSEQARARPEALALEAILKAGAERLSYGELEARSNRLANRLRSLGVGRDLLVGVCLERSAELVVAILAALKAGGAYLPLDPAHPRERLAYVLEDSGAAVVISRRGLIAGLPVADRGLLLLDEADLAGESAEVPEVEVRPGDLAYVIYTSGSTGRPKGVRVEHGNLSNLLLAGRQAFGFDEMDVMPALAPFSFDIFLFELLNPLVTGGTSILVSLEGGPDLGLLTSLLERVTRLHAVPALMQQIVERVRSEGAAAGRYRGLRTLFTGGDAVPAGLLAELRETFPGTEVRVLYGPTEATIIASSDMVPAAGPVRSRLGRPLPNMALRLFDTAGRPAPVGVPGEIWIGGRGVARGYLNRPELTAERYPEIVGERWYRTGDLARRLPDGALEFLGRADDQVKIRGFRIELGEVESALLGLPGVREAAVLAEGEGNGRRLVAWLSPEPGAELEVAALREGLRSVLPDYMIPAAFAPLESLPLTANGKVDRRALARTAVASLETGSAWVAPRNPIESALAGIWAELLGVERVGVTDDFFALGGHSLLAVQVLSRVRRAFGAEVDVQALFREPTVEALAREIAEVAGPELPAIPSIPLAPRDREIPLSFAQARLWFLDRVRPGSAVYNVPVAWRLRGRLDAAALAAALTEIVRRHEALRTRFADGAEGPVQVVDPAAPFPLPTVDLRGLPEAAGRREEEALAIAEAESPFDLARGPLARALLLRLEEEGWTLVLNLHHAVSDAWSVRVLARELEALYAAALAGLTSPLPELPTQYADYAVWQREQLRGEAMESELAWWRERLAGAPPLLELPADRPRPAAPTFRGGTEPVHLGAELSASLRALGRARRTPLFITAFAGFLALLHRLTGREDLPVGTPTAGRDRVELEGLIGFFVNTLVLRAGVSGELSFAGLLGRAREVATGAYGHAALPFDGVVEALAPERDLGWSPLFQVVFSLQAEKAEPPRLRGLELDERLLPTAAAKFDLVLGLAETGDEIGGEIEYDRDLFDPATVRRWAGHLRVLLEAAVADPEVRLSELPLLSAAERGELLREAAGPARDLDWAPVHELFSDWARQRPEALAVAAGGRRLTYGEVEARSGRLAHRLRALGIGPEVLVGICAGRTVERVVGIVAVLKAGGAYLSLDPSYPGERLAWLLEDARAPVLLAGRELLGILPATGALVIDLEEDLEAGGAPPLAAALEPESLAYVIYTSGSTGRPKGVAVSHRGLLNLVRWHQEVYGVTPGDRGTQVASPAFDASVWELWPLLASGAASLVPGEEARLSAARMVRWWAEEGITQSFLPTPLAEAVLEEESPGDLRLRALLTGGDRLHRAPRPGTPFRLVNHYGPTESSVVTTAGEVPPSPDAAAAPPIGWAIANTRVYVLDGYGQLSAPGTPGELHVAGAGLARGYLGRPDLTAERFVPDPWAPGTPGERMYRTGDLVRRLPDGSLDFLGRLDHQVKVRGMRVELGEIETALAGHPGVREAAVLASGGDLTAYVAGEVPPEELRGFLETRLPAYMVPRGWAFLDALPLTPNGKVDRRALERIEAAAAPSGEYLAPRTAVEEALAGIWRELLGIGRVGVRDDFFALGGHSLLAMQVVSRVRRTLGAELEIRGLFEEPTVEALARRIEAGMGRTAVSPLLPVPRDEGEPLPLSFAQARLWFLDQLEPGALYNVPVMYRVEGRIDVPALAGALAETVRRHESLRTRFVQRESEPAQMVDPPARVPAPLPLIDLSGLPAGPCSRERGRLALEEAERPFDLARGPVFRFALVRLEAAEHDLFLSLHHIVSDAWSLGVLTRELGLLYAGLAAGAPPRLPELPVQYADYAVWQRERLRGEALEREIDYWRRRLAGSPAVIDLPADRPRPPVQGFRGGSVLRPVPPRLAARVEAASRELGGTPFILLLAVFQTLLGRLANQAEVNVGTPIANRARMETEGLIGFFVNTLVVRASLAGNPSFGELAGRAREAMLEAQAHQELPFEKLVEALEPERSLSHTPLFQVMFVMQDGQPPAGFPGLRLIPFLPERRTAKFDLLLALGDQGWGLESAVEYSSDLFDAATAARLLGQFHTLLEGALDDPERRLWDLPLLDEGARAQLLVEWNDVTAATPFRAAHERFAEQARRAPGRTAAVFRGEELTYAAATEKAGRLARRLARLGIGRGTPVGVCLERSLALPVALLGILEAGGVFLPLDPTYPADRLAFMLADAGAPVLITQEDLAGLFPDFSGTLLLDPLSGEEPGPAPTTVEVGPLDLSYLIYTSGSTGWPKGVALTHRTLSNLVDFHLRSSIGAEERTLQFSPVSFDVSFQEIFSTWAAGGALVLISEEDRRDPEALLETLERERVTRLFLPFVALNHLAETAGRRGAAPSSLREVITAGEQLRASEAIAGWFRRMGSCILVNHYGPSETHVATAFTLPADPGLWTPLPPIGRPVLNSRFHLLDAYGTPVPVGVPGEVFLGGAQTARGYLNRPDLTADRFGPDPFGGEPGGRLYRTGDLARWLPDGGVEYLGRVDLQVKVRGFRVELGEIEAVLAEYPALGQVAVLAREDGGGGRRLVAYATAPGGAPEVGEIRERLKSRLPEYMVPSAFVWLESMPLTATGKVDRRALAAVAAPAAADTEVYVAPRTAVEEMVAGLWAELLGVARVGIRDDFFRLGGHSLLATQVLARARHLFKVEIDLRTLFNAPTVEALAAVIERNLPGGTEAGPAAPALAPRDPRAGNPPLSFSQARLWFLDRLQPGTAVYNLPTAYRLWGALEPAALAAALREVARRHEILRTRFAEGEEGPFQVIDPPAARALPLVDLAGLPEPARGAEEARRIQEEALRPFDLERGPLFRPLLARGGERGWVLVLAAHHVISDGWSTGVLLRELAALYAAALAGRPSPLPEPPLQYADFAVWQREWLRGDELERQLAYWRQRLAGHPPALELPLDHPRPAVQTFRGAEETLSLGAEETARLRTLGRRGGAPMFMTLLAGFLALLHRYTGQADLLVGTPTAGRGRVELEPLVGFFVNTLVLRADAAGDPAFEELLGRVREAALGAYAHADLPFERLVEELAPERNLSLSPLFQVLFLLQTGPGTPQRLAGLEVEELELSIEAAKFDLTVGLAERETGLAGVLGYNRDLFDPATIRRMARHLEILLAGAGARPEARLSDLPLLSAAERAELLEWNDTAREYPLTPWVHESFAAHARRRPQALAVVMGERRLTYGELEEQSNRLAHHLRSLGVGPDVVVGVCAERTPERVVGIVAILKAGGAYASFDPAYPAERLALAMEDARTPVLLTESRLLGRVPDSAALVVCLDRDLDGLTGDGSRPPAVEVDGDNLAYVIFTSGSTGRPKGVAIPHKGLLNLVRWHHETYGLTPEDVGTQVASPAFDVAIWELWPLLAGGAGLAIPDEETRLSSSRMVRWWREAGITLAFLPTPLADGILGEELPADLPVRWLVVGGDRLHRAPRRGTPFRLSNIYGPAEHSVVTTMSVVPPEGRVTIGRALANTRVHVLDAEGVPVPVGVAGELYVSGEGLARGYVWRPELTAERFLPDPFGALMGTIGGRMYRTGDRVRRLPDGDLDFLGRLDHQVKIRGIRVELGEIESVLGGHPGVREAVVIVREDLPGDRRLTAYVAGEEPPGADELRAFLERRLPAYMVPQDWVLLGALPLTPNGKVDRRALPAPEHRIETAVGPRTPLEQLLADIFRQVFNLDTVGIHDDFFALGGHSLLATKVVSRVRRLIGVELQIRALFEEPTVEGLARRIEAERYRAPGAAAPPLRPMPRGEGGGPAGQPLSFAQARLWFLDQLEPGSLYNIPAMFRVEGRLDAGALAGALAEIVRRHESLRTRFVKQGDEPAQVIAPPPDPGAALLPRIDLSALSMEARSREGKRLALEEAERPFDLARGPVARFALVRLAPEEHLLFLSLHHIVSDGWSIGVLMRELGGLYAGLAAGTAPRLPELPLQYADYAVWQRGWLTGEALAAEVGHWRRRLGGGAAVLDLPTDRPRPAVQRFRGGALSRRLPVLLGERIEAASRELGGTPFIVLMAAFQTLLCRYTGQSDISVGTPIAGRTRMELEGLIGFFVNTLVLRSSLAGNPGFDDLVGRVREAALKAYAHQDLPFEKLVEAVDPERSLSYSPLFQVMFVLQNAPGGFHLPGLRLHSFLPERGTAKFDLMLAMGDVGSGMEAALEYNSDLFDAATAARMLGELETLLAAALEDPGRRLWDLPLLTSAARAQLLTEWNDTAAPVPWLPQGRRFTERARRSPGRPAIAFRGEELTYAEAEVRANRLAHRLRRLGAGPGVVVGVCLERSLDTPLAVLAIFKAGGVFLPLDPSYPADRLAFMLAETAAPVLISQAGLLGLFPDFTGTRLLLEDLDQEIAGEPGDAPAVDLDPRDLAYLIYTSGSTGRPKGIAMTQGALVNLVAFHQAGSTGAEERTLQFSPLSFDVCFQEIFSTWAAGGTLVMISDADRRDPVALLRVLEEERVTRLFLPFVALDHLAEAAGRLGARPSRLRQVITAGEQLRSTEAITGFFRRLGDCALENHYGPSELHAVTACRLPRDPGEWAPLPSIGRPILNIRLYVLDPYGQPAPVGVPGEIFLGGAQMARGYLGRPDLTADRFLPDPLGGEPGERLYRTGDLGRWLPDGNVEFLGRVDLQVKVRGFRIELGEIEAVLAEHPGLREAVVAAPEIGGLKRLVAWVVPAGEAPESSELKRFLEDRLPEYMVPGHFVTLETLPLSATGKVDRRALPVPDGSRDGEAELVPPRTPLEELMAEIWMEALSVGRVGIHDNFWDLGGHSLLATKVLARVNDAFGVELPLQALFKSPTIASLTEAIGEALMEEEEG